MRVHHARREEAPHEIHRARPIRRDDTARRDLLDLPTFDENRGRLADRSGPYIDNARVDQDQVLGRGAHRASGEGEDRQQSGTKHEGLRMYGEWKGNELPDQPLKPSEARPHTLDRVRREVVLDELME